MFDELARLRFFIPKPNGKFPKRADKYPCIVMENVGTDGENRCIIRGRFPDRSNAEIFLNAVRALYIAKMKEEMGKIIEQAVVERQKECSCGECPVCVARYKDPASQ